MAIPVLQRASVFQSHQPGLLHFLENPEPSLHNGTVSLRRSQVKSLQAVSRWNWTQSRIAMIVMPTGTGKSDVAVLACYAVGARRVLVLTPSMIITNQLRKKFRSENLRETACSRVFQISDENKDDILPPMNNEIKSTRDLDRAIYSTDEVVVVNAHKIGDERANVCITDIPQTRFDFIVVDEAHHYPCKTWKRIVDHFSGSRTLFLTATPFYEGEKQLPYPIIYEYDRYEAIRDGVIRWVRFDDDVTDFEVQNFDIPKTIAAKVLNYLLRDRRRQNPLHRAIVVCTQRQNHNSIDQMINAFTELSAYGLVEPFSSDNKNDHPNVLDRFQNGQTRVLVICSSLREGLDYAPVSVIGIYRNIASKSRVFFNQVVGRAVRRIDMNDDVDAVIVSHPTFNQRSNYDMLNQLPLDLGDAEDEVNDEADDFDI